MSWNYRVVRSVGDLRIYDVYYDSSGRPIGRHEQPTYVYGSSVHELKEQIYLMLESLDQPILDESEIGSQHSVAGSESSENE